jgi:hypothetical protein
MMSNSITRRMLTVLVATIVFIAPLTDTAAQRTRLRDYFGLWEAVDPDDGGHQILSITDNGDGKARLLLRDTYWTLCNGSDKGVSRGTAILQNDGKLKSDDLTLTCIEENTTRATPTTFELESGFLNRVRTAPLSPITYHRTSSKTLQR